MNENLFNPEMTIKPEFVCLCESQPHFCLAGRRVLWPMGKTGPAGRLLDMERGELVQSRLCLHLSDLCRGR